MITMLANIVTAKTMASDEGKDRKGVAEQIITTGKIIFQSLARAAKTTKRTLVRRK